MAVLQVRSASLTGYEELVQELGGDPKALLLTQSIDPSLLHNPDIPISVDALVKLFELSAEVLNCPAFGLLLSQRQSLSVLGPLGLMMRQASSFHDAFLVLQKYVHLRSEAGNFELEVKEEVAIVRYLPLVKGKDHCRQIVDLSLGIGCQLMRSYLGQQWRPRAVYFKHEAPRDLSAYSMIFRAPLSFAQEDNALVFDASLLQTPVGEAEAEMQKFLNTYLDTLERDSPIDLQTRIRSVIQSSLGKAPCKLDNVARLLDSSPRSLQRQLRAQGTSFQTLLDEVRQDAACQYLEGPSPALHEIALLLGFSDASTFSRTFRKWFGLSPNQYRKRARHQTG